MKWFIGPIRKYSDFSSRSARKEFWLYAIFYAFLLVGAMIFDSIFGTAHPALGWGFMTGGVILVLAVPTVALTVRRLHDTNRSGWWLLISLIPVVGPVVLLVFYSLSGTHGENRFGSEPVPENLDQNMDTAQGPKLKLVGAIVVFAAATVLLCRGGPPSEAIIEEEIAGNIYALMGVLGAHDANIPNVIESVERLGCERDRGASYICIVRTTLIDSPHIPEMFRVTTSRMRFTLTDEGWHGEEL